MPQEIVTNKSEKSQPGQFGLVYTWETLPEPLKTIVSNDSGKHIFKPEEMDIFVVIGRGQFPSLLDPDLKEAVESALAQPNWNNTRQISMCFYNLIVKLGESIDVFIAPSEDIEIQKGDPFVNFPFAYNQHLDNLKNDLDTARIGESFGLSKFNPDDPQDCLVVSVFDKIFETSKQISDQANAGDLFITNSQIFGLREILDEKRINEMKEQLTQGKLSPQKFDDLKYVRQEIYKARQTSMPDNVINGTYWMELMSAVMRLHYNDGRLIVNPEPISSLGQSGTEIVVSDKKPQNDDILNQIIWNQIREKLTEMFESNGCDPRYLTISDVYVRGEEGESITILESLIALRKKFGSKPENQIKAKRVDQALQMIQQWDTLISRYDPNLTKLENASPMVKSGMEIVLAVDEMLEKDGTWDTGLIPMTDSLDDLKEEATLLMKSSELDIAEIQKGFEEIVKLTESEKKDPAKLYQRILNLQRLKDTVNNPKIQARVVSDGLKLATQILQIPYFQIAVPEGGFSIEWLKSPDSVSQIEPIIRRLKIIQKLMHPDILKTTPIASDPEVMEQINKYRPLMNSLQSWFRELPKYAGNI
jgi:hypothetical protein